MPRIITQNVQGLNNKFKRKQLFYHLHKKAEILCLQETHCVSQLEDIWRNEWEGQAFWSHGTSTARGVCILISKKLNLEI